MTTKLFACSNCGNLFPIKNLDVKPKSLAGKKTTFEQLIKAADSGEDFTILECETCYGPAWQP